MDRYVNVFHDPFASGESHEALVRCLRAEDLAEDEALVADLTIDYSKLQARLAQLQRLAGLTVGQIAMLGTRRYNRLDNNYDPLSCSEFDLVQLDEAQRPQEDGSGRFDLPPDLYRVPLVLGRCPQWDLVRDGGLRRRRIYAGPITEVHVVPIPANQWVFWYGNWNCTQALWLPAATPKKVGMVLPVPRELAEVLLLSSNAATVVTAAQAAGASGPN